VPSFQGSDGREKTKMIAMEQVNMKKNTNIATDASMGA
jgi:hypothetical protein